VIVVNVFVCVGRGLAAAFLGIAVLVSPASAVPQDPIEECFPQPVAGTDAILNGTLRLMEPAIVGYDSRISMSGASLQLPDPKCDGQFITVPLTFRWDILTRPAGSTGQLASSTSLTTRLKPDVAGSWQVAFTACPNGCRTVNNITVPAIRRTISFTSTLGIEGRLNSDFVDSTAKLFLGDSRIQISQTGDGTSVAGTPYTVEYYPGGGTYEKQCLVPEPPDHCDELLESIIERVEFRTITPTFSSYFDFGPTAELLGAPAFITLPVEVTEQDIPTAARAAMLAVQGFGALTSIDIDRVRLLVNNVHIDLGDIDRWEASVGGGSVNLKLAMESAHPTIKCEAHYTKRVGFIFNVNSGWADNLCPDYDLSKMELTLRLFPIVQQESLIQNTINLSNVHVELLLEPAGLQSELIDVFTNASNVQEVKIAEKIRAKLIEANTRAALGKVLLEVVKHKFPDMKRIRSSQIVGSEWIVRYDP
jgi:hypothetical protein